MSQINQVKGKFYIVHEQMNMKNQPKPIGYNKKCMKKKVYSNTAHLHKKFQRFRINNLGYTLRKWESKNNIKPSIKSL